MFYRHPLAQDGQDLERSGLLVVSRDLGGSRQAPEEGWETGRETGREMVLVSLYLRSGACRAEAEPSSASRYLDIILCDRNHCANTAISE